VIAVLSTPTTIKEKPMSTTAGSKIAPVTGGSRGPGCTAGLNLARRVTNTILT
jgi:hypothetical protein